MDLSGAADHPITLSQLLLAQRRQRKTPHPQLFIGTTWTWTPETFDPLIKINKFVGPQKNPTRIHAVSSAAACLVKQQQRFLLTAAAAAAVRVWSYIYICLNFRSSFRHFHFFCCFAVFCLPFTALVCAGTRTVKKYDALADCPAKYELRSTTFFFYFAFLFSWTLRIDSAWFRCMRRALCCWQNFDCEQASEAQKGEEKNGNALWSWRVAASGSSWWCVKLNACHRTPNGQIICGLVIHTCLKT